MFVVLTSDTPCCHKLCHKQYMAKRPKASSDLFPQIHSSVMPRGPEISTWIGRGFCVHANNRDIISYATLMNVLDNCSAVSDRLDIVAYRASWIFCQLHVPYSVHQQMKFRDFDYCSLRRRRRDAAIVRWCHIYQFELQIAKICGQPIIGLLKLTSVWKRRYIRLMRMLRIKLRKIHGVVRDLRCEYSCEKTKGDRSCICGLGFLEWFNCFWLHKLLR